MAILNDLIVSGPSHFLSDTTINRLIITATNDATESHNNGPALTIGGTPSTAHIEIDNNEIMAKSNATTVTTLYLGGSGGTVNIQNNLIVGGTITGNVSGSLSGNASTATKATQDSDGNQINSTYLKLSGGTLTGNLTFTTTKGIKYAAVDNDTQLWQVYDGSGAYGYALQYKGSGSGNNNDLVLISDNQNGTKINAVTMKQDGTTTFAKAITASGGVIGNASTATNVAWSGVTSKPSYYDAKAIKGITRSGTTFTYTCMDGTTGTFTQQDNNTTYSAGTGISLSGTTFSNSGVRSITTGTTNGTISVNTNGTTANVAVKGLGSAAYTNSTAYAPAYSYQSTDPGAGSTLATGKLLIVYS